MLKRLILAAALVLAAGSAWAATPTATATATATATPTPTATPLIQISIGVPVRIWPANATNDYYSIDYTVNGNMVTRYYCVTDFLDRIRSRPGSEQLNEAVNIAEGVAYKRLRNGETVAGAVQ